MGDHDRDSDKSGGGCRNWLLGCGGVLLLVMVVGGGFLFSNWDRVKELANEIGEPIKDVMALQEELGASYPGHFEVKAHRRKSGGEDRMSTEITWRDSGHAERSEEELEILAREIAVRAVERISMPLLTREIVVRCESRRSAISTAQEFTFAREDLVAAFPPPSTIDSTGMALPDSGDAP